MSRPVDHRQGIAVSECSGGPFFGCHFQPCPRRSTCFLGPRPSSLEPIALPHPNSQTTKTCRGTGRWAVPRRRARAGGRAPAEISWSSNPPPSPSRSPCPQPPHPGQACGLLARQRLAGHFLDRAGGELCSPPARGNLPNPSPSRRRPVCRGRDPGRLPRRTPRAGESAVERVDGGGRGALPRPPRRRAEPCRGTNGPGPRGLSADRR